MEKQRKEGKVTMVDPSNKDNDKNNKDNNDEADKSGGKDDPKQEKTNVAAGSGI